MHPNMERFMGAPVHVRRAILFYYADCCFYCGQPSIKPPAQRRSGSKKRMGRLLCGWEKEKWKSPERLNGK